MKKMRDETLKEWNATAQALVGRKIVEARYLTDDECRELGWQCSTLLIRLDNGITIVPMSDDEGNNAGALLVENLDGECLDMAIMPLC